MQSEPSFADRLKYNLLLNIFFLSNSITEKLRQHTNSECLSIE